MFCVDIGDQDIVANYVI